MSLRSFPHAADEIKACGCDTECACNTMGDADMIIVGAGIYGLTNAVTYHRMHPEAKVLIIDAAPCIGGPWAAGRIFPGLKTNNILGMYEHPDFPMTEEKFGVKKGEHIPAEKMLEYLETIVKESGIETFLRLNSKVDLVDKSEEKWTLHGYNVSSGLYFNVNAAKLIIAVGNTNNPKIPCYPKPRTFESPFIHSYEFPAHFSAIVRPSSHTLVIGGGKSAWDVAYACATQPNATATLLIRPSGNGPNWMTPTHVTPFTLWLEKLVFTRFFGFMSPCPWAQNTGLEGWLRSFLHGTWLGRKIVAAFWKILGDDAIALNKLNEHPETRKLVPWRGAFEVSNCLSIHNYPTNFFELVREGRIKILIDEVQRFEEGREVVLKSGEKLQVDAVVCATGWDVGKSLMCKPELKTELGLPTNTLRDKATFSTEDAVLVEKTETDLLDRFPYLKQRDTSRINHPDHSLRYAQKSDLAQQPYRLYRFIAPPATLLSRNITFAGAMYCLGSFPLAYIQSLWIAAYFDDELALPSTSEAREEAYRNTQYCILRNAMGNGRVAPDIVFDSLPYFDVLLRDLGIEGKRKGGALKECYKSYGPEDYRGLLDEMIQKRRREGKKDI